MKVEGVVTALDGMLCLKVTADYGGKYQRASFASVCEVAYLLRRFLQRGVVSAETQWVSASCPHPTAKTAFDLRNPEGSAIGASL